MVQQVKDLREVVEGEVAESVSATSPACAAVVRNPLEVLIHDKKAM
jgi:hypothetical protein